MPIIWKHTHFVGYELRRDCPVSVVVCSVGITTAKYFAGLEIVTIGGTQFSPGLGAVDSVVAEPGGAVVTLDFDGEGMFAVTHFLNERGFAAFDRLQARSGVGQYSGIVRNVRLMVSSPPAQVF